MQEHTAKQGVFYVRYMDDILILAATRHHLRSAIKTMHSATNSLGLQMHQQEKCFIGRALKGFGFLGYHFHPVRKLRPSAESLRRLDRLWPCVARWFSYVRGGLNGVVSPAGGVKRYWVYVLKNIE